MRRSSLALPARFIVENDRLGRVFKQCSRFQALLAAVRLVKGMSFLARGCKRTHVTSFITDWKLTNSRKGPPLF